MSHQFIIDNKFLFTVHNNRIENMTSGDFITLITPASRCLETLLLNHRVVSHQELYASGWGGSGKEPTPASLYQNILLIRKAFKELAHTDVDYITTIPRKGFVFKKEAAIIITDNEAAHLPVPDVTLPAPDYHPPEEKSTSRVLPFGKKNLFYVNTVLTISCVVSLIIILSEHFFTPRVSMFSDVFTPYVKMDNCHYHLEKETTLSLLKNAKNNPLIQNLWYAAVEESGVPCSTYPWRYIIFFEHENKVRTVACTRPGDNDPAQECITLFKRMG